MSENRKKNKNKKFFNATQLPCPMAHRAWACYEGGVNTLERDFLGKYFSGTYFLPVMRKDVAVYIRNLQTD